MPPRKVELPRDPLSAYLARWNRGCGNAICGTARHIVHVRGDLPCDVFFVGEAPGESEDVIGRPFEGPAGQLLDHIIREAVECRTVCKACARGGAFGLDKFLGTDDDGMEIWGCLGGHYGDESRPIRYALGNLIGCIPRDIETGRKVIDGPDGEEIIACAPRLTELLALASPKLLVNVGAMSRDWMKKGHRNPVEIPRSVKKQIEIIHPAAILRGSIVQRGLSIQRCIATLATALEDMDHAAKETEPEGPALSGRVPDPYAFGDDLDAYGRGLPSRPLTSLDDDIPF